MIQVNSRQDAADSAGTFPDPKSFEDTSHRLIQQNLIDTGEHRPHAHVERGWEWKSARHVDPRFIGPATLTGWLYRRDIILINRNALDDYHSLQVDQACLPTSDPMEQVEDVANAAQMDEHDCASLTTTAVDLELHVIFDQTYRIPQLLFGAALRENGKTLSLDELVATGILRLPAGQDAPINHAQDYLPLDSTSMFPLITHIPHPLSQDMWLWAVHPCRTQEHVDELVHDEQASEEHDDWDECRWRVRWLQLWMMVVSSIVKMGGG